MKGFTRWALGVSAVPGAFDIMIPLRPSNLVSYIHSILTGMKDEITVLGEEGSKRTPGWPCSDDEQVCLHDGCLHCDAGVRYGFDTI